MGGVASKGSCLGDTGVAWGRSGSDSSGSDATFVQQQQAEQLEQQQTWEYMLACYGVRPPIPPLPAIPEDAAAEEAETPPGQPHRRSGQHGMPQQRASAALSQPYVPAGAAAASVPAPAVAHPHAVAEGRAPRPVAAGSSTSCAESSEAGDENGPLRDESENGEAHSSWEDEHLRLSESACSEASEPDGGGGPVLPHPSPTSSSATQLLQLPEDTLAKVLQHLHRGRDRMAFLHSCKALRDSAKCLAQLRILTLFPRLGSEDAGLHAQVSAVPRGARITNLIIRMPLCDMRALAPLIHRGLHQHAAKGSTSNVDFVQVEELQLKMPARCPEEPAATLAECLPLFPRLSHLTIKTPSVSPLLLQQLRSKQLHSLALNMAPEQAVREHYAAIAGITSLASLKLKTRLPEWDEPTEIEPDLGSRSQPLIEDVSPLSGLCNLQHLEVRHVKWCDDESKPELRGLQPILDHCPLAHLVLDTPAHHPRLKCPPTLTHLSLGACSLQGLPELTDPSLCVLELPYLRVELCEEGVVESGAKLRHVCSIPDFHCRDLEVTCAQSRGVCSSGALLECLAECAAKPRGVRSLTLCRVRLERPEQVQQLCTHLPSITSLSLSSCELAPGCLAAAGQEFECLESLYVWLCLKPRLKLVPHLPDVRELVSVLEARHSLCLALSVNVDVLEQESDTSCQDAVRSWKHEVDEAVPAELKQRLVVSCWLNVKEAEGYIHGVRI